MAVQRVIDDYPEAFLHYDSLPESLLQQLDEASRPVVPVAVQSMQMQYPALGELPAPLQPQHWRRLFARMGTTILVVVRYGWGRKS